MALAVALAKDTTAFLLTTMVAARVPSRNAAISATRRPRRARSSVHGGGNTALISWISRAAAVTILYRRRSWEAFAFGFQAALAFSAAAMRSAVSSNQDWSTIDS